MKITGITAAPELINPETWFSPLVKPDKKGEVRIDYPKFKRILTAIWGFRHVPGFNEVSFVLPNLKIEHNNTNQGTTPVLFWVTPDLYRSGLTSFASLPALGWALSSREGVPENHRRLCNLTNLLFGPGSTRTYTGWQLATVAPKMGGLTPSNHGFADHGIWLLGAEKPRIQAVALKDLV